MAEMRMTNRSVCFVVAAASCLGVGGCHFYDVDEVRSFLQSPRREVSATEYRVFPPDILAISWKDPARGPDPFPPEVRTIRPDGKINLPLLGEVYVTGRTPREIEQELVTKAKKYYREINATVDVQQYRSQKYYVLGHVARPGPVPWTGRDTLLDALSASPPTDLAWPERIIVVRGPDPQTGGYATSQPTWRHQLTGVASETQDKPRRKMTVNLMAMVKSGDMGNNILLRPNDIVYVQPNPFAKIGLTLQMILHPTRPVLEAVRVPASVEAAVSPGQ
jgi:protein involved in polysaccharide export with SLBB domain